MTKKSFLEIARAISRVKQWAIRVQLANDIGRIFAQSNPRFDWNRWLEACRAREADIQRAV